MSQIIGLAGAAITSPDGRHLPIEDGDVIIFTLPATYSPIEAEVATDTCQRLRDELQAAGKTVSTVIIIDSWKLETATRASIQELYGRLGLALLPNDARPEHPDQEPQIWLSSDERKPEHVPERRSQKRQPAFNRRKQPR